MARYRVHEAVTAEVHHSMLGACTARFGAGEVKPSSEQEQVVLDQLVVSGLATLIEADPVRDPALPTGSPVDESAAGSPSGDSQPEEAPSRKRAPRSRA